MGRYRSKVVEVEAICYDGDLEAFTQAVTEFGAQVRSFPQAGVGCMQVYNDSHHDWNLVNPGDWIIHGLTGEFYPCDPVNFASRYEEIGDDPPGRTVLVWPGADGQWRWTRLADNHRKTGASAEAFVSKWNAVRAARAEFPDDTVRIAEETP